MKRILVVLFAFALVSAQAQTADEIIQKYSNAMGGLENFKKLKTLKMTGNVSTQGMDLPITIQIVNEKAMRTDVEAMGQTVTNVYKDGKGWKINPFAGAPSATDVEGTELNDFRSQSFLANELMDYKGRGCKVEMAGQEDVDGVKTYKLNLTDNQGKVTTYYLSTTTFIPVKAVAKREMMGQEMEIETFLSDLKEFNGLKFNTAMVQKTGGQVFQEVHFDKLDLNVPVDEKIFDKK